MTAFNYIPAPYLALPQSEEELLAWEGARVAGTALLRRGALAVATLAGGLGTRLGFPGPKGLLPLKDGGTLFEGFARQLLALAQTFGEMPFWVLLTSDHTHAATAEFFHKKAAFGLDPQRIFFIIQKNQAILDLEGQRVQEAPDGHGGLLGALRTSGCLNSLIQKGFKHLSVFQVDNPLSPFWDATFLGFHAQAQAQMSCRVVLKENPAERLGLFCLPLGQALGPRVVEYHEVPEAQKTERLPDGALRFCAGNLGQYLLDLDFLASVQQDLPLHRISTQIPDPKHPKDAQASLPVHKYERYLFDLLPLAQRTLLLQADRQKAFRPIKEPGDLMEYA